MQRNNDVSVIYRERVYPHWAVLGFLLLMSASLAIAYGDALGTAAGIATLMIGVLASVAVFLRTSIRVEVDHEYVFVDSAALEMNAIASVNVLDANSTKLARGRNSHPDAYLRLLSGTPKSVIIAISDESDPHPYWQVSSKRPQELCDAILEVKKLK